MITPAESIFGAVDADEFERMTGFAPDGDDLERTNCPMAGEAAHMMCGICPPCGKPRFVCGHPNVKPRHDR